MTAGDLIDILRRFPSTTEVIIAVDPFEWRRLSRVDEPCGDEDDVQRAICLLPGGDRL